MMSRPRTTGLRASGPSRGGNHPKTLRGSVGKEKPARPRSHIGECNAVNSVVRRASSVIVPRDRIIARPADIFV